MMIRRSGFGRLLAGCVLVIGGGACSEPRPAPPPVAVQGPEAAFAAQLDRTWELTRLGNQDLPPSAPRTSSGPGMHPGPGTRPTLRFTNESAAETSGIPGIR